jgi:hypothetical protein
MMFSLDITMSYKHTPRAWTAQAPQNLAIALLHQQVISAGQARCGVPHTPHTNQRGAALCRLGGRRRQSAAPLQWQTPHRMILGIDNIVPERLHRRVGWDIRHHFMAEKLVDRFGLKLPRDRELIRQLAVVYVLEGRTRPPEVRQSWQETGGNGHMICEQDQIDSSLNRRLGQQC